MRRLSSLWPEFHAFADIVAPVFLALMLTVAVHPFPEWLRRKGLPNWLAVLIALVRVWGILLGVVLSIVVSIAKLGTTLPQYADNLDDMVDNLRSLLASNGVDGERIRELLTNVDAKTVFGLVGDILSGTLAALSNLVFIIVLLFFMAIDASSYSARIKQVVGLQPEIATALVSFSNGTRNYLVVATVFGLIVAVIDTAALWMLGVPLPILWGLLAFTTNYIPSVGFVLGVIPRAFMALLSGGPELMLAVIVLYSVVNVVIQSIIQPKFVGDAVGLSVTISFLALVFWAWVLGPLGALLAIPMTLLAKALFIDIDPSTRWLKPPISEAV